MAAEKPDAVGTDRERDMDAAIRLRKAEMLLGISRTIAAFNTLDEMLFKLVEITTEELGADRGTILLHDVTTGELYSRVAQGERHREIRLLDSTGVAGRVFTTGEGMIVNDAYASEYFNPDIDRETGYTTRSILCVPIHTARGERIGVAQVLNKKSGPFTDADLATLTAMTLQAAVVLQGAQLVEEMQKNRDREMDFMESVSDVTAEIDLATLLKKVMAEAAAMLNAERSTLFLNDARTGELFSKVGAGLDAHEIRFPNHLGIAGMVFTSGETVNIPHAYADLRFNPAFDKQTGFFTRSILCTPVINKRGKIIGVTQVLNKFGGPFTDDDASRLRAFTAQVSIALENAKLFDDVQNMKNYNESILESMSSGVITLDEKDTIVTCNAAGMSTMGIGPDDIVGKAAGEFFSGENAWIAEQVDRVRETGKSIVTMDSDLAFGDCRLSVNVTVMPLVSVNEATLGTMIMIEDISSEKRMKSTMSRYMDPGLADRLLAEGEDILGGTNIIATILFSDIRNFTSISEEMGAQGTVALLNEYFTMMVDCIHNEGGMLDKFIGDALMAAFGTPIPGDDDADRGVRTALAMIGRLTEWNASRIADGLRPVEIGIGLNTDTVVSGNIGSPKRMDYTLIGDGVNLAARLESACKQYHARILVSEHTVNALKGTYRLREVDLVVVKGKTEPVGVYELMDYHTDATYPRLRDALAAFREGLAGYRGCDWGVAEQAFREVLAMNPADRLAELYLERCAMLRENPPGDDWDGVWTLHAK